MKATLVVLFAGLVSLGSATVVMDFLVDEWLAHASDMMNSTYNSEYAVKGMQFYTECGAFITKENCTAVADLGVVKDLSKLTRVSPVIFTSPSDRVVQMDISLAYQLLEVHYPNMVITGEGIMMEYKGIDTKAAQVIPIGVHLSLDYTSGVATCDSTFELSTPSIDALQVTTTIREPPATLTLESDLTKNIINSLMDTAKEHVAALINYKKPCSRLANLI